MAAVVDYAQRGQIRGTEREGAYQAALCARAHDDLCVIDREATFSPVEPYSSAAIEEHAAPLRAELCNIGEAAWRAKRKESFGTELDALAIDSRGCLLAVEVKPPELTTTTAWAPAQALLYAQLFQSWCDHLGHQVARAVLHAMVDQRVACGLSRPQRLAERVQVVPVVAIGSSASAPPHPEAVPRMREVRSALRLLARAQSMELWTVDGDGHFERVGW